MHHCVFISNIVILLQGDQGIQGDPGPFEYVEPNPEDYIKGEKVKTPTCEISLQLLENCLRHGIKSYLLISILTFISFLIVSCLSVILLYKLYFLFYNLQSQF